MILRISDADKEFSIRNIENAEMLFERGDLNSILDHLDLFITAEGFDVDVETDDWQLNDIGRIAQRIYDRLYYNNP